MKQFIISLGLGRLSNNYPKTFIIDALSQDEAVRLAKIKYYQVIENEIGPKHPIFGKMLTVSKVEVLK